MKIELTEDLRQRIADQQEKEAEFMTQEPNWGVQLGNYRDEALINSYIPTRRIRNSEGQEVMLQGYEVFLYDTALQLLARKKTEPVIMLDIGGGVGSTWNRLGIALRDYIENSRLALIVSNISADPEKQLEIYANKSDPSPQVDRVINQSRAEIEAARGLVQYVNGTFFSLRMKHVTLHNGNKVKLEGNTDFIHERFSLTPHTYTPELDVPAVVGHLLSPYGIYSIPESDTKIRYGSSLTSNIKPKTYNSKTRARSIGLAHRSLEKDFGLKRVSRIRAEHSFRRKLINHIIYRGPQAPSLRLR